jgi:hypothetical protein
LFHCLLICVAAVEPFRGRAVETASGSAEDRAPLRNDLLSSHCAEG